LEKSNKKQNTIRGSALLFSCPDRPVVRRACGASENLYFLLHPLQLSGCFETLSITLGGDTFLEKFGKETKQKNRNKIDKSIPF
jgi:hypothetical protein